MIIDKRLILIALIGIFVAWWASVAVLSIFNVKIFFIIPNKESHFFNYIEFIFVNGCISAFGVFLLFIFSIPFVAIYDWAKENKKFFFYQIVPVSILIIGIIGSIFYSRNEKKLEQRNIAESYIIRNFQQIRRKVVKISDPENCSIDVKFIKSYETTKNNDLYEVLVKTKIIQSDIIKTTNKQLEANCKSFFDLALDSSDNKFTVKLLDDGKTVIDTSADEIYLCIPIDSKEEHCTYKNDSINSKLSEDECIDYNEFSSGVEYKGYYCKSNKFRKNLPNLNIENKEVVDMKGRVSVEEYILSNIF
jgi:hypothetical protein